MRVESLREVSGALQCRWNRKCVHAAGSKPLSFVGSEEECLVVDDGSAYRPTEHVIPKPRLDLLLAAHRRKEARRVHRVVTQVFVRAAVQLITPGFGCFNYDAAGRSPVFSSIVVGQNSYLANGLHRWIEIDLALTDAYVLTRSTIDPEHLALRTPTGEAEVRIRISWRIVLRN